MALNREEILWNIAIIFLGIIALVILILAINRNKKIDAIRKWPKIHAMVLESTVKDSPAWWRGKEFIPEVTYVYTINGKEYESKNINPSGAKYSSHSAAEQVVAKLTSGTSIVVYYNPANPRETYIHFGTKFTDIIVISTIILAGIIVYYCYYAYMRYKEKSGTSKELPAPTISKPSAPVTPTNPSNLTDVIPVTMTGTIGTMKYRFF